MNISINGRTLNIIIKFKSILRIKVFTKQYSYFSRCLVIDYHSTKSTPQDPIYPPADVPFTLHQDHWRSIRTRQRRRGNRVPDCYNYRLSSLNMGQRVQHVKRISYYHSLANNNGVFEPPFFVGNRGNLQQVRSVLGNFDVFEWARQQRPYSKWIVMDVTNATFLSQSFAITLLVVVRVYPNTCWKILLLSH